MDEVLVAIESSDALVGRLVAFCDDYDVEQTVGRFMAAHVDAFHGVRSEDERSHTMHTLFQEYEALFERIVQQFLEQEQVSSIVSLSPEAFFAHCRRLQRERDRHEAALSNLQLLLSALDFALFCELMETEAMLTQQALKAAHDMGL